MGGLKGITIDIGGNTQPLNKALQGVNKEAKGIQSELKGVEKALKLDPKNTEMLTQKQGLLKDAIGTTEDKLKTLKDAQAQTDAKMQQGLEVDQSEYRYLQREIAITEGKLENYKDKLKNMPNSITKTGENFTKVGDKMEGAGKKLLPVTAGIVAIGTASIAMFNEIDEGYDTIIMKTGATGDALDGLYESADTVFTSMPSDMADVGVAIGEINTRFGSTGEELESLSELFLKFAEINETDLNTSIGNTDKILEAFQLDASETGNVLGIITQKAQDTGISVDNLMNSVMNDGSVFKEMGLGVGESVSLLAQFEAKGVNTTAALAGLKKAQQNATASGKPLTEVLGSTIDKIKNATTETGALETATELFGKKGAVEMTKAIREGRFDLDDLTASMDEYGNVVGDTFEATLDAPDLLKQATNNLKLTLSDLGTTILEMVTPYIEKLGEKLGELKDWFAGLSDSSKEMIVKIGGIVAIIAPALIVVGKLSKSFGWVFDAVGKVVGIFKAGGGIASTISTFVTGLNPVFLVIGAIVAGFAILYAKSEVFRDTVGKVFESAKQAISDAIEPIKEAIGGLIETFQGVITDLQPVIDFIGEIASVILTVLGGAFNGIVSAIAPVINAISGFVTFISNLVQGVFALVKNDTEGFKTHMQTAIDALISVIKNLIQAGINFVNGILKNFGTSVGQVFTKVKEKITEIWNKIVDFFTKSVPKMVTTIIDGIKSLPTKFVATLTKVLTGVTTWIGNMVTKAKDVATKFLNSVVSGIKSLPTKFQTTLTNVVSKITTWGTNLKTKATTICKNLITSFVNGMKNLPTKFVTIGSDIVKGLWNGVNSVKDWVIDKIKGFSDSILKGIKDFFKIKSPSQVMRDEVGLMLAEGVVAGLQKGTKKAKKTAQELGQAILDSAKKKLDNYKVYNDMSLKDEMDYWNKIRKECKKGTQAKIDADKEYLSAKQSYKDSIKETNAKAKESEQTHADAIKKINEDLKASVESLTKAYEDAVTSRAKTISSSTGLFNEFSKNTEKSGKELLTDLQSQVTGISEWKTNIALLKERGISDELLAELREMGVKSAGEIQALTTLTDAELDQYVALFGTKNSLATDIATEELEYLKDETSEKIKELNKQAQSDLESQNEIYKNAMKELGINVTAPIDSIKATVKEDGTVVVQEFTKSISAESKKENTKKKVETLNTTVTAQLKKAVPQVKEIGVNVVKGMIAGIESQRQALASAMASLVNMSISSGQVAGDIHSPSRKSAKKIGVPLAQGVEVGIKDYMRKMSSSLLIPDLNGQSGQFALATAGGYGGSSVVYEYGGNEVHIHAKTVDMDHINEIVDAVNVRLGKRV